MFALRVPKRFRDGVAYERDEEKLAAWDADWRAWWESNRWKTPAQTVLTAIVDGELPLFEGSAEVLVDAVLNGGNDRASDDELSSVLNVAWPDQSNLPTGSQQVLAEQWHLTRNAAILVAYKRDRHRTFHWLSSGVERSGQVGYAHSLSRIDHTAIRRTMSGWLPPQLKLDIEQRIRDVRSPPVLRMKWLVLHDQLFPPDTRTRRFLFVGTTAPWAQTVPAAEHALIWRDAEVGSHEFSSDAELLTYIAARGH